MLSAGFNLQPGDRVIIGGIEQTMHRTVPPLQEGGPDDIQFVIGRTGRLVVYTESEFQALHDAEGIRFLTRTERITDRAPEDDKGLASARRKLAYVQAFDADPGSRSEGPLAAFIASVALTIGDLKPPSTGSVRRWLRERGEPGLRRLREMADRYRAGTGRKLHPFAEDALTDELERYWDSPRVTAKEVWARLVTRIAEQNALSSFGAKAEIPSPAYTTVWRRCQAELTYERARRRFGAKAAERMFKAIRGSLQAEHILEVVIMDHTEVDCWVIDDITHQPIGRPRITFLIDSCSRCVLAFNIGWKPASVEAAMACLRQAMVKKDVRADYPEIRHEWLGHGQPHEILVDQGLEFVGSTFEDTCADLGISVRFAPVRTPEFKGQIERFIGTFNTQVIHPLPGSVPGKPAELRALGIDPEKDAVLLLSDLKLLITKWVVDVYSREPHRELNASPAQIWQERLKTDPIQLCPDLVSLNAACAKKVERLLTREGIALHNLTYRSSAVSDLLQDLWPGARKRNASNRGVPVKVKYHPDDLSRVFVWNNVRGEYVELPCTRPDYAMGLSEYHHSKIREWAQQTNRAFNSEDDMCRARVELLDLMNELVVEKVRDRKRLQRLRHPERDLSSERVRLSTVDNPEAGSPNELDAIEVLIDPLRNRANGGDTPGRIPLNRKTKRRAAGSIKRVPDRSAALADAREQGPSPFASFDFEGELAVAMAEAEGRR